MTRPVSIGMGVTGKAFFALLSMHHVAMTEIEAEKKRGNRNTSRLDRIASSVIQQGGMLGWRSSGCVRLATIGDGVQRPDLEGGNPDLFVGIEVPQEDQALLLADKLFDQARSILQFHRRMDRA